MMMIKALSFAVTLSVAVAQGQHNGVDCAQALGDMSDDLNHVRCRSCALSCGMHSCSAGWW